MTQAVDIMICTLNRPDGLMRAVRSARAQELPPATKATVLVVDNSPTGYARTLVAAIAAEPGLPVTWVPLPRPSFAGARNAGVAAGTGQWVAFLDDDEWAEPGWLAALLATAAGSGADVVFGPVLAAVAVPQAWDPDGRSLERRPPWPSGTAMPLRRPPEVAGMWIGTGNSLLRRATCLAGPAPFDEIGFAGSEDFDLFLRLDRAGRRFVWCAEAVVHETVPPDRCTTAYRMRRNFVTGQQWATIMIRRSRRPRLAAGVITARAMVQFVLVAGLWLVRRVRGADQAIPVAFKLAETAGKLLWHRYGDRRGGTGAATGPAPATQPTV